MRRVLVIYEKDLEDNEVIVIGVVDSLENVEILIGEYYGKFKEVSYRDIRDSSLEYEKLLEVEGIFGEPHQVKIWLEWFVLNCV